MYNIILNIALRNAYLRKSRAILLILMIGLSMGIMLSIEGLYNGMTSNIINNTKRSDCGELSIFAKGYRENKDFKYHIKNSNKIIHKIIHMDGVQSVVSRLKVQGLAKSATKSYPSSLIGVDFDNEENFGKFSEFISKGDLNLGKRGCAIGKELAKHLKLKLNSKVIFTARDINGNIQSTLFRIKAIIYSTNIKIDNQTIFIQKDKLNSSFGLDTEFSTQISIRVSSQTTIDTIKNEYLQYDVLDFKELYPSLKQMQDMMNIFNSITFFIVMFVVFIGILGVMYVSILDRIREFGIMIALGYKYSFIKLQVILEALFLGLSGFIFGAIIGYMLLLYLKYYGLNLSNFADGLSSFGLSPIIYADIQLSYFTSALFAIIFASIISVFLPLQKIKKLNPTEVIKAES